MLIGTGLDTGALRAELDGCVSDDAPHADDEAGMWGVLRYVQEAEEPEA